MVEDNAVPPAGLVDRDRECGTLERLVADVRGGKSRVLVLRGDAGIGKSALLAHLSSIADGCGLARATGVESEMELAFAGLHALCVPMLSRIGHLPGPQRAALDTAFGLNDGAAPDRFLVGLAVLNLLADAAEEQPLVCVVDDAQWLDRASAQTLAFVARRLLAERVALVFAVRASHGDHELKGLPELVVEGLPTVHAVRLLEETTSQPLDAQVRQRILSEAAGNPLALLELPRGQTALSFAGEIDLPTETTLTHRLEQRFLQEMEAFEPGTRRLLLLAAAEPLGDVPLLWRAAERIGIAPEAAAPAEASGLLKIGARVAFRHPLVRSAVYRSAEDGERREAHRVLADATDPRTDADRRAWHRARAAEGPDEDVATELESSADRAQSRGGLIAAAAFLERAAELTPAPTARVDRLLAAAEAKLDVADLASASALVEAAELGPVDDLQRARVERLAARITFAGQRGREAPPLLLAAARRLQSLDAAMARETYLEAIASAMFAARLSEGPDEREIATAALELEPTSGDHPADLLLAGLVARFTEGFAASVEPLRQALITFAEPSGGGADWRWLWLACRLAPDLWDDELWRRLATRGVNIARENGSLSLLPNALNYSAAFSVHSGNFQAAAVLTDEVDSLTEATGLPPLKYAATALAATRGEDANPLMSFGWRSLTERGEGSGILMWQRLAALRLNGRGRYEEALANARQACSHEGSMAYGWALVELIEAAVHTSSLPEAETAFDRLTKRTQPCGTPWALGIEARCRALVGGEEAHYQEAIEHLTHSHAAVELARSRLTYGEWLRRQRRRIDARELLRAAYDAFSAMGAEAFAERARGELAATGETVRKRTSHVSDELTAQEAQVARLAAEGLSNPEIGARLFISPRTVQFHLRKVFQKLGITSRNHLARFPPARLGGGEAPASLDRRA